MKRILIKSLTLTFILLLSFNMTIIAQVSTDKTKTDTITVNNIKNNAEKWFRMQYVEPHFKDPYSYRLMGIKANPITIEEALKIQLSTVLKSIDKCRTHPDERNQEAHDLYMKRYEENKNSIKKEQEYIDSNVDAEYHTKKKAIYVKHAKVYLKRAESIALYLLDEKEKNRLENDINNLTPEKSSSLAYYDIRLDCYSKNSLGNEVLGRYSFPFTENGPLYGDKTIKHVLKLND